MGQEFRFESGDACRGRAELGIYRHGQSVPNPADGAVQDFCLRVPERALRYVPCE